MENNIDVFNSVNYLFAKPYCQGYYYYALDDLDTMSVIDKDSLKNLLIKLGCGNFIKIDYLMDRNFPFFFDVKKKELLEFQETNSEINKEDLIKHIHEELKANINQNNNKSPYERFFGKDSDFYKQNIYDTMENNKWQSSMNTKQLSL